MDVSRKWCYGGKELRFVMEKTGGRGAKSDKRYGEECWGGSEAADRVEVGLVALYLCRFVTYIA